MTHPVALWILTGRPRKLLVIVNPFGGQGAGKTIFVQIVEPMLQAARIAYAMKGANQALSFPSPLLSSHPFPFSLKFAGVTTVFTNFWTRSSS
jgi:hypothetical protein